MINILETAWWDIAGHVRDAAGELIINGFYSICFVIDNVVYSFIPTLYNLLISLANVDLYTGNQAIASLMNRVYILIGIFMLFKLAFSVMQYIIDPNAFSDQSKGFTNLVKRVLIALVLLASIPWIFGKVYEVQGIILEDNVLPNLILGTKEKFTDEISTSAKDLQFLIFSPFFAVNPVDNLASCKPSTARPLSNLLGTVDMALRGDNSDDNNSKCLEDFSDSMSDNDVNNPVVESGVTLDNFFKTDIADNRDFGAFGGLLNMKTDNGERAITYLPIASTIVGGYLAFLLISFCIDIAARAICLMFLQILSPIAIITSIDPTASSSNDRLKEWGKECLTTFASLFLRLAVIFSVIQMVKIVTAKLYDTSSLYNEAFAENANGAMDIFVYIFLVLGAFQVAKKIPELLEKAFGIKMSGELNLNPFKALSENAGVGALVGGVVGSGATGLSSAATAFASGRNLGGVLKSGTTGLVVGAIRGGRTGFGQGLGKAAAAGAHSGGISARNMLMRRDKGIDFLHDPLGSARKTVETAVDAALDKSGGPDLFQIQDAEVQRLNNVSSNASDLDDTVKKNAALSDARYGNGTYKTVLSAMEAQEVVLEQRLRDGKISENQYVQSKEYIDKQRKTLFASYFDQATKDTLRNENGGKMNDFDVATKYKEFYDSIELLDSKHKKALGSNTSTLGGVKDIRNKASDISKSIQSSDSYQENRTGHETRKRINEERFYETGPGGGK